MHIPSDFQKFLNNNNNKEKLFAIIEERLSSHYNTSIDRKMYFARGSTCKLLSRGHTDVTFTVNHEETDTKLICLVKHTIENEQNSEDATFIIRSTSGDIDIPVILLNAVTNSNVFIDSGRGNNRKLLCIQATTLTTDQKKAIVGLRAFTGTDQNSSFFRKSKMRCWKITQYYLSTFSNLGKEFEMTDDLIKELEEYVSCLYGGKSSDVNALRNEIFWKTIKNKKQIINLFHLPPCRSSLKLQARRNNYIANIWRQADQKILVYESPQQHGRNEDYLLEWVDEIFPTDIARHLDARYRM